MASDTVSISIITASYNSCKTIERCMQSVVGQSYANIEHIIIDGGSTDGTQEIIGSYQKTYPLIWISEPDRGISDALNKGLHRANGDYILVLQADDRLYLRNSLAKAVSYLEDQACDVYTSPVFMEHPDGGSKLVKPLKALWCHRFKTPFRHQGSIVHRRIYERVGLFSEAFSIAMDYDFFYRVLKSEPSIKYVSRPLSVMGADGVGSRQGMVRKRIDEEYQVQKKNEASVAWRILQDLFRMAYLPYKVGVTDFSPLGVIFRSGSKKS